MPLNFGKTVREEGAGNKRPCKYALRFKLAVAPQLHSVINPLDKFKKSPQKNKMAIYVAKKATCVAQNDFYCCIISVALMLGK